MGKLTFNLVNDLHLLRSRQYRKMVDRLGRVQDLEGHLFISIVQRDTSEDTSLGNKIAGTAGK